MSIVRAILVAGRAPSWIAAYAAMTKGVAALGCPFVLREIEGERTAFAGNDGKSVGAGLEPGRAPSWIAAYAAMTKRVPQ